MKTLRKKTGKKKDKFGEPDEFLSLTQRAIRYVQGHTRQSYWVMAVAGAVVVLTILVAMLMESSRKNVLAMQAEAMQYYDVNSPVPGNKPMSPDERMKKAGELFGKIVQEHGGNPVAKLALYYKSNADMELDNIDSAMDGYKKLLEQASGDPVLTSLASLRLARAYLVKGRTQDSINAYMSIIKSKEGYLVDEAHFLLAGIYEKTGNKEFALAEYRTLEKNYPGSPWIDDARRKIAELGGVKAGTAAPGTPGQAAVPQPVVVAPPK